MDSMNPMRFSQTYELITDESAEHGEAEERGFDWQDSPYSFEELVNLLRREYRGAEPSDSHGVPRWITRYGDRDFRDGTFTHHSLHPANERAWRWWPKALKAAGIIKGER